MKQKYEKVFMKTIFIIVILIILAVYYIFFSDLSPFRRFCLRSEDCKECGCSCINRYMYCYEKTTCGLDRSFCACPKNKECISLQPFTSANGTEEFVNQRVALIGRLECKPESKIPAYLMFNDSSKIQFLEEIPNCLEYDNKTVKVIAYIYECNKFDSCTGIGLKDIEVIES